MLVRQLLFNMITKCPVLKSKWKQYILWSELLRMNKVYMNANLLARKLWDNLLKKMSTLPHNPVWTLLWMQSTTCEDLYWNKGYIQLLKHTHLRYLREPNDNFWIFRHRSYKQQMWPNTTKGTSCLLLRKLRYLHYLPEDFTSFPMIPPQS